MRSIIASAALLFCLTGAVSAAETPAVCDNPQKITEGLVTSSAARGFTVSLYDEVTDPALVAQFVQVFNETPPASNIASDMVLVFAAIHTASGSKQPGKLAIFFHGGCQVPKAGIMMTPQAVDKILGPQA